MLDQEAFLARLFFPRKEWREHDGLTGIPILVPVERDIRVSGYLHEGSATGADIPCFFTGTARLRRITMIWRPFLLPGA